MWTFLVLTGLRVGSFLSLTRESFAEAGIVVPHTKRGQDWMIRYDAGCPLWRPELGDIGRAIWAEREPTRAYMRFHFEGAVKAIGRTFSQHGLRHAFCSWLVMMGEHMSDVAAWAHHASSFVTERYYAHFRPNGKDGTIEATRIVCAACSAMVEACAVKR